MRIRGTLLVFAAFVSVSASADDAVEHAETGYRTDTILIVPDDGGCGTLVFNADGTYENGYAWQYGGNRAPDYGCFVERYSGGGKLCSAVFDFTDNGKNEQSMYIFVYCDVDGLPGPVLFTTRATPGGIGNWPVVSRHTFQIDVDACDCESWWVGFWGDWQGAQLGWFIAADLDGFGGFPFTNIAPGIGYPTGWQNVSVVWGPTQALGIGAEVVPCDVPVIESTWGRIKTLYKSE